LLVLLIVDVWGIPRQPSREVATGTTKFAFNDWMKTNVITNQFSMPVSLDEFQKLFIDDSATFSVGYFHSLKKDFNFAMSRWIPAPSPSSGRATTKSLSVPPSSELERDITFSRPLRGMKPARATKYQKWIKIGQEGCVLTSTTRLEDVPCSDCFSVDESMVVLSSGEHSVNVKVSWEVQWFRNSLMRSLIESNTRSEMKAWLSSYLEHMLQHVANSPSRFDGSRKPQESAFLVRNLKNGWNGPQRWRFLGLGDPMTLGLLPAASAGDDDGPTASPEEEASPPLGWSRLRGWLSRRATMRRHGYRPNGKTSRPAFF
jgi:hypothetical protein